MSLNFLSHLRGAVALIACATTVTGVVASLGFTQGVQNQPPASAPSAADLARTMPATFYVSPQGVAEGAGTVEAPLDLATALSAKSPARPGDTIWVRGGVYLGAFTSRLRGTQKHPIIVRQVPGERATIDSTGSTESALFVEGAYTWFWGLEIRNGDPRRVSTEPLAADLRRGAGVTAHAPGVKLINMVVHDMKNGLEVWASSPDAEVYGNLIYHNGYAAEDRGHGHGIYAQNRSGSQRYIDNVMFSGFNHGIHVYGSDAAYLNNVVLAGNIVFNSGLLSSYFERNILLGGGRRAENPVVTNNYTYFSAERRGGENNIGYAAGCIDLVAKNNYWAHPRQYPLVIGRNCLGEVVGNVLIGHFSDEAVARFPGNDIRGTEPTGVESFLRPNRYEPGRANVVVFNWNHQPTVDIDLRGSGLIEGTEFEIRDAQNYYGPPVYTGTYSAKPVTVAMDGGTIAAPAGNVPLPPQHTTREFGAFVILPKTALLRP